MSTYFGEWRFGDPEIGMDFIDTVNQLITHYSADGTNNYREHDLTIVCGAFHTTRESRDEVQPYRSPSGLIFTWDGRLDNRSDLIQQFSSVLSRESPDVSIAALAYERWQQAAFARLAGDWAISIWDPSERKLVLAKDAVGTRHLYWHISANHILWTTSLDLIDHVDTCSRPVNEEYIAGWLSQYPDLGLTPFTTVHSVCPGSTVRLGPRTCVVTNFDNFRPPQSLRYRDDREYEEHFRSLFAESIRRRLRSEGPVLAELSGGMDSSSIVCMADRLMTERQVEAPRVDTVSFFDPSEPNWDESLYFSKVEELRGCVGCHIDVSRSNNSVPGLQKHASGITPGDCLRDPSEAELFAQCLLSNGNRVVLSGIGGDEVLGGVPSPLPELADLLVRAQFQFFGRLREWALASRQPIVHLLAATLRSFLPASGRAVAHACPALEWLRPQFVQRHETAIRGSDERLRLFGPRPSCQENLSAIKALQKQLTCSVPRSNYPHEVRYPYLDKDLLEFLFAIPREQIVRPGQRRSLMRRALVGIVPQEILERKRKAYVLRGPMVAIARNWTGLRAFTSHMVTEEMGIVDACKFRKVLSRIREGAVVPLSPVIRTLLIEQWLRGQIDSNHGSSQVVGSNFTAPARVEAGCDRPYAKESAS
jgi:asparagine synthase (glutamine-hydrolysing)